MKKTTITIKYCPKESREFIDKEIQGYKVGEFLAAHKKIDGKKWSITHLPTGSWLGDCFYLKDAVEIIEAISDKIDWSLSVMSEIAEVLVHSEVPDILNAYYHEMRFSRYIPHVKD